MNRDDKTDLLKRATAAAVRALLVDGGFSDVQSWKDLAGIERTSGGRFT